MVVSDALEGRSLARLSLEQRQDDDSCSRVAAGVQTASPNERTKQWGGSRFARQREADV